MIHKRIITFEGDPDWIERTIKNSLPEGVNGRIFGEGRKIIVETIEGEGLNHEIPDCKPEKRYDG